MAERPFMHVIKEPILSPLTVKIGSLLVDITKCIYHDGTSVMEYEYTFSVTFKSCFIANTTSGVGLSS